ncbi:MAG: protein-L-isoaspartate(D-aspartate) O-methyltransferase [Anaerolineae bacterium]|nr:MAG: protein-L-isoaspartate(D-aspartate) O-methyltransferase [Anaerolineae bacterium]
MRLLDPILRARARMVREQLAGRGIRDPRVLAVMGAVPRHVFVPPERRAKAYADQPLPIGEGQTISQPYIVARMTELLALQGDEKVLEIGGGSGYQAAVLAGLARTVISIERHEALATRAATTLHELGIANVTVIHADGSGGWPPLAPYDAILMAAAAPRVPSPLLDQLAEGGRLVLPAGGRRMQRLERHTRHADAWRAETFNEVAFVPLRGEHGWND